MRTSLIPVILISGLLASCGSAPMMTAPMQTEALVWLRTDGQSGRANPALVDQFAADRAACGVTPTSDNMALRAAETCMSTRGYVLVPASQAEATAASFRANTAAQYPAGGGATSVTIGGSSGY